MSAKPIYIYMYMNPKYFFSDRYLLSFFMLSLPKFVEAWSVLQMLCEERHFSRPHSH